MTAANLEKQRDLQQVYAHKKEERVRQNREELQTTAGRKRIRELAEDDYLNRPEIRVPIPDMLKSQLVDDWEFITKDQRVFCVLTVFVN
jgi:mortality factor 4-like protein 1